ncbi:MAG: GDP-L-fucose synthase [Candidatus Margulisbacteria bacterium]|nr:GDP-L-fucose synthase [Candidatus Margulisiibacteriota bacterium]
MLKDSKIYIAGHQGMVGSAVKRKLEEFGYTNIVTRDLDKLDLTNQSAVKEFFEKEKPEYVFMAAAKVGGILANDIYSAEFIYINLMIQNNVIHYAHENGIKKLLFLGSSCIYPRECPQPMKEEYLMTGPLEQTNEAYAVAKIAGIKMCQMYRKQYKSDFISVMPTNMYGPNDNYHPQNSHVFAAFVRRFHEAKENGLKEVVCWGTGKVYREFLFVEDCAEGLIFLMNNYSDYEHVNIGTGKDVTIKELAETMAEVIGYQGKITWDNSKPDGTPRKLLDVSKINNLGWKYKTDIKQGISESYKDFLKRFSK